MRPEIQAIIDRKYPDRNKAEPRDPDLEIGQFSHPDFYDICGEVYRKPAKRKSASVNDSKVRRCLKCNDGFKSRSKALRICPACAVKNRRVGVLAASAHGYDG